MTARALAIAAAIVLATGGVGEAGGEPAPRAVRAARLRQRGLEHFVSREYQLAADELMEAYRLDKREETLFGWAEAVRATGDCELATRIYERLLHKTTAEKLARQAELAIAACEAAAQTAPAIATASAPEAEPAFTDDAPRTAATEIDPAIEPAPADDAEPPAVLAPPPPAPAGFAHTTSYIVIGSGSFVALAGVVAYASANSSQNEANASHAAVTSARSNDDWRRLIGASLAVVGGGVALVGIMQYRREGHTQPRDHAVSFAPYASATGGGLAVSGQF